MILSHMAPSSLNMSSYRAIWTHFRSNSMILIKKYMVLGLGPGPGPGPGQGPGPDPGLGYLFKENHGIGFEMGPYGSI